jgi:hypothetical protein
MRSAILAAALIGAVGVAALAEPGNERPGKTLFPLTGQEVEVTGSIPLRAAGQPHLAIQDQGTTPVSFGTSGKRFSCAQIRVMDEVELITDDTYCD